MNSLGKTLRTVAIVFFGLTAAMNLLGGAGTSCAAFFTEQYPPMWALYDYQWLYQGLVVTTLAIGVAGIWATIGLMRGKDQAYRNALIVLVIGVILGAVHMAASLALRGKAVPANVKLYLNAATLLIFLLLALPGVRQHVNFFRGGQSNDKTTAGGVSAFLAGLLMLTTPLWAGPSHTFEGTNWVYVLWPHLSIGGTLLLLTGLFLLAKVALQVWRHEFART
jgi:hypothetical protein